MNGCPLCGGLGMLLAQTRLTSPAILPCPECSGLAITPASADDHLAVAEVIPGRFVAVSVPNAARDEIGGAA